MSTSLVGDITHVNASTTGMCVLQTTDEVDIGGHYNSTLEQGQCFVLTLLTLPQTAPTRMSNVGHSRAAIGQSEGRCPLTCTGHPPCRTPPTFPTRETSGTSREVPIFLVRGSLLKAMMSQSHDKKRQSTLGEAWGNSEKKSREAASVWGLRD